MVNACCIYGTSLTVKNMYDLLQKNHGDILIKLNLDTYQKFNKCLNNERFSYLEKFISFLNENPEDDEYYYNESSKDDHEFYYNENSKDFELDEKVFYETGDNLFDFLSYLNKELSLSICKFKLNSCCCCVNRNSKLEIFLGWQSNCGYRDGDYSKKIKMISDTERNIVDEIINKYTHKTPNFYVAVADCEYCS